jgi:hypothetical protein
MPQSKIVSERYTQNQPKRRTGHNKYLAPVTPQQDLFWKPKILEYNKFSYGNVIEMPKQIRY